MASDLKPRTRPKHTANRRLYVILCACAILIFLFFTFTSTTTKIAKKVPLPTVLNTDKLESAASAITKGISGTSKDKSKTANKATVVDEETHALVHELKKQAEGEPVTIKTASTLGADAGDLDNWLTTPHETIDGTTSSASNEQQVTKSKGRSKNQPYDAADSLNVLLESYEMIIFSKSYCPHSKKAKLILEFYDIRPKPLIYELDIEANGSELQAELGKLTGRRTVPNIVVNKKSLGGGDEIAALDKADELITTIRSISDRIDITKKSKRT